jgi:hypothetical protein
LYVSLRFERKRRQFSLVYPDKATTLTPQGCKMRNTEWTVGIVVFAGPDTKLMQNSGAFDRLDGCVMMRWNGERHALFFVPSTQSLARRDSLQAHAY